MLYTFTEIKNNLSIRISHHLFENSDIKVITKNMPSELPLIENTATIETGLTFTYSNKLFATISGSTLCLKAEAVKKFDLIEFVKSNKDMSDIANSTFVKVYDSQEFYDRLYEIANELFLFYLNQKELSHFGCCNSHIECSSMGYCINKNKELYCGCDYRRNLEKGKNFYKKITE